jgi:hypothetical protein
VAARFESALASALLAAAAVACGAANVAMPPRVHVDPAPATATAAPAPAPEAGPPLPLDVTLEQVQPPGEACRWSGHDWPHGSQGSSGLLNVARRPQAPEETADVYLRAARAVDVSLSSGALFLRTDDPRAKLRGWAHLKAMHFFLSHPVVLSGVFTTAPAALFEIQSHDGMSMRVEPRLWSLLFIMRPRVDLVLDLGCDDLSLDPATFAPPPVAAGGTRRWLTRGQVLLYAAADAAVPAGEVYTDPPSDEPYEVRVLEQRGARARIVWTRDDGQLVAWVPRSALLPTPKIPPHRPGQLVSVQEQEEEAEREEADGGSPPPPAPPDPTPLREVACAREVRLVAEPRKGKTWQVGTLAPQTLRVMAEEGDVARVDVIEDGTGLDRASHAYVPLRDLAACARP